MNTKSKRASKVFTWMVLLATLLAGCELLSLVFTKLRPDLFDWREPILSRLRAEDFERFKRQFASETLGWDNPADQTLLHPNCVGVEITYTYDQNRLRVHRATSARDAVVLVAGDSYTHGDEVGDTESFPASLERILQAPVANLGVAGYGPAQAVLNLEARLDRFPRARA